MKLMQGLTKDVEQLTESRRKFAGKVQTKHWASPMHERVIFTEAQPLIELPKGITGAGNGFVGKQVGEDEARSVGQRIAKEIDGMLARVWPADHGYRPLQRLAQHGAENSEPGQNFRFRRQVHQESHVAGWGPDTKKGSQRFGKT